MAVRADPPSLRIVAGEVETKSATTQLVIPTSSQPAWPPFVRVGETLSDRVRQFPAHTHEHHEVLTYVSEGFASYQLGTEPPERLVPGSARLLTVPSRSAHRISPAQGGPIRWFNLVVTLPPTAQGESRLQGSEAPSRPPEYDGTPVIRPLVGPKAPMASAAGLECRDITFVEPGTTFQRVGHERRGFVYVLSGRGTVDGHSVEMGEAALADGVAGLAIHALQDLRVITATAPR